VLISSRAFQPSTASHVAVGEKLLPNKSRKKQSLGEQRSCVTIFAGLRLQSMLDHLALSKAAAFDLVSTVAGR